MTNKRDYLEYSITANKNRDEATNEYLNKTGGYEKFTNIYHDPSDSSYSPIRHRRDLNGSPMLGSVTTVQIKPKLVENGLVHQQSFQKLSPNF